MTEKAGPRILYFVHDLADPAVARRVRMLRAGGAVVDVIGFQRGNDGIAGFSLGRTYDANLAQRAIAMTAWLIRSPRLAALASGAEVILCRNLEMLVLAAAARRLGAPQAKLVYECLDIHRSLLGSSWRARLMRAIERVLLRGAGGLVVSSPAFVVNHFAAYRPLPPVLVVENRLVVLDSAPEPSPPRAGRGAPWLIGWFGVIRCRRSLEVLQRLTASRPNIEVIIRGRPTTAVFPDLEAEIASNDRIRFLGSYQQADLPSLYAEVDFVWAIDFFEAGQNSAWLLPNRLYEGVASGRPILALFAVETGRWVEDAGVGVTFDDLDTELPAWFSRLTTAFYDALQTAASRLPRERTVCARRDCLDLVERLAS